MSIDSKYQPFRPVFWIAIAILSLELCLGCTVPVFRYALDNWAGQRSEAIEEPEVIGRIADQILAGNSAVWIQIDSGDKAADDAAFQRLEERLRFFESVAQLPEIDPNDPSSRIGPGPTLAIRFSAIRIDRSNPVSQLITGPNTGSLPEDEAWIAPVFGRGRVLGAWPASLMDEEGIDEACFYLTGACSCQVKIQNPGWDLPMNVKWDERLLAADSASAPPEAPLESRVKSEPADTVAEEVRFTPVFRPPTADINLTYLVVAVLLVVGAVLLLTNRKAKSK